MDADSGELYQIRQSFFAGDYAKVIEETHLDEFEDYATRAKAHEYILRSKLVLKQDISEDLTGDAPYLRAIELYKEYLSNSAQKDALLSDLEALIEEHAGDECVEVLGSIIYVKEGRISDALKLLEHHEGSLEAVQMIVQIHLLQNRLDLALKELAKAKTYSQDSIIYNLAEAWANLRAGEEKYMSAFYIYEELSQTNSTVQTLNGLVVATLLLGRIPEASEVFNTAYALEKDDGDLLANGIALAVLSGKDPKPFKAKLEQIAPNHPALNDLNEKKAEFDSIVASFADQVKN